MVVPSEGNKEAAKSPLLIITCPRTASNLLMRMISLQDQEHVVSEESGGYFFLPALGHMRDSGLIDRAPETWTPEERSAVEQKFQTCYNKLQELVNSAESQGKLAVVKEHAAFITSPAIQSSSVHSPHNISPPWTADTPEGYHQPGPAGLPVNKSVFPDEFLLRCTPSFLIRHPALAFPSYYRVMLSFQNGNQEVVKQKTSQLKHVCSFHWTRNLYDWYKAAWEKTGQEQKSPIVLEADDILTNPELVRKFCDLVGLDSAKVKLHWDPVDKNELSKENSIRMHTRATLLTSSGITQGKTFHGLSIEGEVVKWKQEFGNEVGERLEGLVRDAMPDYEYLAMRRLTVSN